MTAIPIKLRLRLEERTVAITCTVIAPDPDDPTRTDADKWIVRCTPMELRTTAERIGDAIYRMKRAIATWLINARVHLAAGEG